MLEALIVVALIGTVVVVAVLPWSSLVGAGLVTATMGLAFGVATGGWYHVELHRALVEARALAPRWWLRPARLHERLDARGRQRVLPWFYAGAAGFFVTVAGIALIALGMAVGASRAP